MFLANRNTGRMGQEHRRRKRSRWKLCAFSPNTGAWWPPPPNAREVLTISARLPLRREASFRDPSAGAWLPAGQRGNKDARR